MSDATFVRYAVRNVLTGEFVSDWQGKGLNHEWTSDPWKIRSYVSIDEAHKLYVRLPGTVVVELAFNVDYKTIDTNVKMAEMTDRLAGDIELIKNLDKIDERDWTDTQSNKYKQARIRLTKHGFDLRNLP